MGKSLELAFNSISTKLALNLMIIKLNSKSLNYCIIRHVHINERKEHIIENMDYVLRKNQNVESEYVL